MAHLMQPEMSILLVADSPLDPDDWMARWADMLPGASMLSSPLTHRSDFDRLSDLVDDRIAETNHPTLLVARGRACEPVAKAIASRRSAHGIAGSMLVAPLWTHHTFQMQHGLGITSVIIAPDIDLRLKNGGMRLFAATLGSYLVNGGDIGRADTAAGLGDWSYGRYVLNWLVAHIAEEAGIDASTACQGNVIDFQTRSSSYRHTG